MSAPNQPELETPPNDSPSDQTAATTAPTDNNNSLLTFYAEQARHAREESSRMAQELADARAREQTRANAAPPVDYSNYNTALSEGRGAEAIAEIVRREVASTVQPIADSIKRFDARETAQSEYARLKATYRHLPYFASIENDVDTVMQNAPPTAQAMDATIRMVIGNAVLQGKTIAGFNSVPSTQTTQVTPVNTVVPAQLTPATPAAPARVVNGQAVITEREREMMTKQGMTPEEYVFWRDVSPADVVRFKWDKATNAAVRV